MIEWREEFSVGVAAIDEQHKRLFEIANQAYSLLKNDLITDKFDRITDIIEELKEYTIYHFDYEEKYMEEIGFRRLLSHKVHHKDFIDKINSLDLDEIDENQDQAILGVLDFVTNWIQDHILGQDKKYAEHQS